MGEWSDAARENFRLARAATAAKRRAKKIERPVERISDFHLTTCHCGAEIFVGHTEARSGRVLRCSMCRAGYAEALTPQGIRRAA